MCRLSHKKREPDGWESIENHAKLAAAFVKPKIPTHNWQFISFEKWIESVNLVSKMKLM